MKQAELESLIGKKFGSLMVIGLAPKPRKSAEQRMLCRCIYCGKESRRRVRDLTSGRIDGSKCRCIITRQRVERLAEAKTEILAMPEQKLVCPHPVCQINETKQGSRGICCWDCESWERCGKHCKFSPAHCGYLDIIEPKEDKEK